MSKTDEMIQRGNIWARLRSMIYHENQTWKAIDAFKHDIQDKGSIKDKMLLKYLEKFKGEEVRLKVKLKKMGNGHPDFLEKEIMKRHLKLAETYVGRANQLFKAKISDKAIKSMAKELKKTDSLEIRNHAKRRAMNDEIQKVIGVDTEKGMDTNEYIEDCLENPGENPVWIVNDLNMPDDEVRENIKSFVHKHQEVINDGDSKAEERSRINVRPFGKLAKDLIKQLKELKPDMIILPLRGAYSFMGLVPNKYKERIVLYNTSEHLPPNDRYKAISRLLKKTKELNPKKVVWLDDVVFHGLQAGQTKGIVEKFLPDNNIKFKTLALIASEPKKNIGEAYYAVRKHAKWTEQHKYRAAPMLASKWLRLMSGMAKDRQDLKEHRRILTMIKRTKGKGRKTRPNEKMLSGRP